MVLKGSILNEATTAYLLTQVDIEKKENQFNFDSVKLGTKQKQMLSRDFAVRLEKKRVQMGLALTVRQILKKLKKRSMLNYSVVRNVSSLDPSEIVANKDAAILKFTSFA